MTRGASGIRTLAPATVALWAAGCGLIDPGESRYLSNREILGQVAEGARFRVDPRAFQLFQTEVREDAVLLYYRGVRYPGDQAWIWRFSPKSHEQDPDELTELSDLAPVVEEGREGFEPGEIRALEAGDARGKYLPYRFDAPIRADSGEPHQGRGILGILEREIRGERVVFYFNLDNWGDRPHLEVEDLKPLIDAMLAGG